MKEEQQRQAPRSLLPTLMGRIGLPTTGNSIEPTSLNKRIDALQKQASLETVLQALDDSDESVRAVGVRALEQWREQAPQERIVACLDDSSWLVREAAVLTLAALEVSVDIARLKNDESPYVREVVHLHAQQRKKAFFSAHTLSHLLLPSLRDAEGDQGTRDDMHADGMKQDENNLTDESDEIIFSNLDDGTIVSTTYRQKTGQKTRLFRIAESVVAALVILGLVGAWFTFTGRTRPVTTNSIPNPARYATSITGTVLWNQRLQNSAVAWTRDDTYLIAVDSQNGVYALDMTTRTIHKSFTLPFPPVDTGNTWEWSFAPDARYLVVASQKGAIQIWDTIAGRVVIQDNTNASTWPTWEWSTDGSYRVVIGGYNSDGTAQIWNAHTGKREATLRSESLKNIRYFVWSPYGQYIALLTAASSPTEPVINGMVQIWNVGTGKEVQQFSDGGDTGTIVWSPDSTRIATASNKLSKNTTVRIWAPLTGHKILTLTGHSSVPLSLQWSNNVACLLSTSAHETLIWNVNTGYTIIKIPQPDLNTLQPSLSPDGNFLAVSTQDNSLQIWSTNSRRLLHTYKKNPSTIDPAIPAVWSPNSGYICFVSSSGKLQMLSTFPESLLTINNTTPDTVQSLTWSYDNTMLAVTSKTTLQVLQDPG